MCPAAPGHSANLPAHERRPSTRNDGLPRFESGRRLLFSLHASLGNQPRSPDWTRVKRSCDRERTGRRLHQSMPAATLSFHLQVAYRPAGMASVATPRSSPRIPRPEPRDPGFHRRARRDRVAAAEGGRPGRRRSRRAGHPSTWWSARTPDRTLSLSARSRCRRGGPSPR
jgi:hypothetical protein